MINSSLTIPRPIRLDSSDHTGPDRNPFTQQVIQDRIGRELRQMYAELMDQPVPDHLATLLSRLEKDVQGEGE